MDDVFRALADPSRRLLLDRLRVRNGQTLTELGAELAMARQSVTKHLAILESANLITTERRGREKLHHLNAAPINDIADRWIHRYDRRRVEALANLKRALEDPMERHEFRYTTYIRTTPERLWQALIEPAFTEQYWGMSMQSDWAVGSPILVKWDPDGDYEERDQMVLEYDPPRRLAYRWHNYQKAHQGLFGWRDDYFEQLVQEPLSQVSFELEPFGDTVKLTVVHDGFETETEMLKALRNGWPAIMANLKTLLETDQRLPYPG